MSRLDRARLTFVLLAAFGASCHPAPSPAPLPDTSLPASSRYVPDSGPVAFTETLETWHDPARDRDVPVKIYAPSSGDGPFPVILFSHGLGSSRQGYVFLGREWASRGYVSIHAQHVGSDSEVLRTKGFRGIYRSALNAQEYGDRPKDMSFILDEFERRQAGAAPGSIWSKLDLSRVGAAGHSYGAHTSLTLAGMLINFPDDPAHSFRDARVKAALMLSIPTMEWSPTPKEFAPISIPTMFMSGTKDTSWVWHTSLMHRRRGFDSIHGAPRYFLNIDGATHQSFADHETVRLAKRNGRLDVQHEPLLHLRNEHDQREIDLILEYADAFWDAYLKGSPRALAWLASSQPAGATLERGSN